MKRLIILSLLAITLIGFSACVDHDRYLDSERPLVPPGTNTDAPDDQENANGPDSSPEADVTTGQITELYALKMRRELPYPFPAYVLKLSNGRYYYVLRTFLDTDLHQDDVISFKTYTLLPDEISRITAVRSARSAHAETRNFVATDPTEATVRKTFELGVRYSLTFVPIKTVFIYTGNELVYAKKIKLGIDLNPGDRIVYNVYRLFPNEILAVKKLN